MAVVLVCVAVILNRDIIIMLYYYAAKHEEEIDAFKRALHVFNSDVQRGHV